MVYLKNILWINGALIPFIICYILINFIELEPRLAIGISFALFVFQKIVTHFGTPLLKKSTDKNMREHSRGE
ncbi:MAG: hypothetical protein V3U57_06655 [Robiginitomaculum sp.]